MQILKGKDVKAVVPARKVVEDGILVEQWQNKWSFEITVKNSNFKSTDSTVRIPMQSLPSTSFFFSQIWTEFAQLQQSQQLLFQLLSKTPTIHPKNFPPGFLLWSSTGARLQSDRRTLQVHLVDFIIGFALGRQCGFIIKQTADLTQPRDLILKTSFFSFRAFLQTWLVTVVNDVCFDFFYLLSSVAADNASHRTEGLPWQYKYAALAEKVSHSWSFFNSVRTHNCEAKWKWKRF